jgi:hypothetical protein
VVKEYTIEQEESFEEKTKERVNLFLLLIIQDNPDLLDKASEVIATL